MLIQLSYWDVEEAVIDYLKKSHNWEIESEQIQGGDIETTFTTYALKKDEDGDEVFDYGKATRKKKNLSFDGNSEMSFFIDAKENKDA
tara:strand:+ start:144 stop:407 length:264 start_codon:yes stop_codon:yes gene_type:complete